MAAKLVVICGATATGKSDLAVAIAKEIGGEIVNADSMQLYKGMDIGTAKLSMAERQNIAHHLLDVVNVSEDVKNLLKRARLPDARLPRPRSEAIPSSIPARPRRRWI